MAFYKIEEPTPVQSVVIPYITEKNCDLIIQAQTGSGKTHAFLLPIIDYIIKAKSNQREYSANTTSPYAIIVAPTKELALQIACDATRLTQDVKWRVGVTFSIGGYDPKDASKMINAGCDILVVTVGRLFDYFGEHERQNVFFIEKILNMPI
jgi:ATP-dependent RNA helicase RhlB